MKHAGKVKYILGFSFFGCIALFALGEAENPLFGFLAVGWIIATPCAVYILHKADKAQDE